MPPRQRPSAATSQVLLAEAVEQAPDVKAVWKLLNEWRKKRSLALATVAEKTAYWDDGLVALLFQDNPALDLAIKNSSWPAWASLAIASWAVQALLSESANNPLWNALWAFARLAEAGRFSGTSDIALELTQSIDGRASMANRQIVAGRALLGCDDLPEDRFNHVATAILRGGLPHAAVEHGYYGDIIFSAINNPRMTPEWIALWLQDIPVGKQTRFVDQFLTHERWRHLREDLLSAAKTVGRARAM